jgi:sec-independent protein translocase protein TatA
MGGFGPIHWIILAVVVLVLFGGRGKVSDLMGDFAKGIKSFRQGLSDHDDQRPLPDRRDEKDTVGR